MLYQDFIEDILQKRGRHGIEEDQYKEEHHIIPKSLGGTNDEDNLIDLLGREHFIAHQLLAKENPHNKKLQYAWWMMAHCKRKDGERYECTPEEYEEARIAFKENISGKNSPMYGKHLSEEAKKKESESKKGKCGGEKHPMYGKHHTLESRKKMSQSKKGQPSPSRIKVECDGQIFESIEACAKFYDIEVGTMEAWLRGANRMRQDFIDKKLHYYNDDTTVYEVQVGKAKHRGEHPNSRKVFCDGQIFDSLESCAEFYGKKSHTMGSWLRGDRKMPKEFEGKNLKYISNNKFKENNKENI